MSNDRTKSKWGIPTWYFMHTYAEKINPNYYKNNKIECFNIIRTICYNLPCPYCREHAISYLRRVPTGSIDTKEKLKNFLWQFHNSVNKRTGKKEVPLDFIIQYKDVNMLKAWIFFEQNFFSYYKVHRSFNAWQRNSAQKELQNFFKTKWSKLFS